MTLGNLLNFLCLDSLFVKKKKKKIGIIIMIPASFAFKSLLLEMIFISVTGEQVSRAPHIVVSSQSY